MRNSSASSDSSSSTSEMNAAACSALQEKLDDFLGLGADDAKSTLSTTAAANPQHGQKGKRGPKAGPNQLADGGCGPHVRRFPTIRDRPGSVLPSSREKGRSGRTKPPH